MIPQSMQPPPLTVIAHGKLPFHVMFQFQSAMPGIQNRPVVTPRTSARLFNPPACFALDALLGWLVRISLVRSERDTNVPPEKFRHKATVLILL
jgi:hypothetical protein